MNSIELSRNQKKFQDSLKIIKQLHQNHPIVSADDFVSDNETIQAKLTKGIIKGYSLENTTPIYNRVKTGNVDEKVKIHIPNLSLESESIFVNSISPPFFRAEVQSFHSVGFSDQHEGFFRLFIPIKEKFSFRKSINTIQYQCEDWSSIECIRIEYKSIQLDLCKYTFEDVDYLTLDSLSNLAFKIFSEYCFSALLSLGYVTGKFFQDEGYFFYYNTSELDVPEHFFYTEFRDSIFSSFLTIHSNAHAYESVIQSFEKAEEINSTLRNLSSVEFSKLCQLTHESVEFSAILILILEATTSSLFLMPAGLSVALEGLTEIISKNYTSKMAPIENKALSKKIINLLKNTYKEYISNINKNENNQFYGASVDQSIIDNKINDINRPTNRDKLTKPFEILKIDVSKDDKEAIDHRNDFLHGRVVLFSKDNKITDYGKAFYIASRLYTLTAALILKQTGYDNKIVNYSKLHENPLNEPLDEPIFRQI